MWRSLFGELQSFAPRTQCKRTPGYALRQQCSNLIKRPKFSPTRSGGTLNTLQRPTSCTAILQVNTTRALRHFRQGSKPSSEENPPGGSKQILERTANIRAKLRDRISKNLKHENIYTLPNILTFSRLLATPFIGYFILHDAHAWAVGLLFYAGVTDLVDGWVARRWNLQTVVGTIIDPLADKSLMTILTVCLAVKGALPIWLATLILGRDVSLAIAAMYYRFASLPPPKTFARYWDFSLPSAEVHPTGVSKANTFLQLLLIGATTAFPIAGPAVDAFLRSISHGDIGAPLVMTAAQYLIATTTIWSGASYLFTRKAVKILGEASPVEKKRILVKGRLILGACFASCLVLGVGLEHLYS